MLAELAAGTLSADTDIPFGIAVFSLSIVLKNSQMLQSGTVVNR